MTNLFRLILPILPLFVGSIACNQQVKDDGRQGEWLVKSQVSTKLS